MVLEMGINHFQYALSKINMHIEKRMFFKTNLAFTLLLFLRDARLISLQKLTSWLNESFDERYDNLGGLVAYINVYCSWVLEQNVSSFDIF